MDEQPTDRELPIQSTVAGLLSALMLWIAFLPGFWGVPSFIGWVALLPLLSLVHRQPKLHRREYLLVWLGGTVHWIIMMCGLRHAHPALIPGWIVLSMYLGAYFPVFVGLTRVAVHRWRMPTVAAAPMVWVGLELIRGYAFSGFSAGLIGHTQSDHPYLIQIADLGGSYAVSLLVMTVTATIAEMLHLLNQSRELSPPQGLRRRKMITAGWGILVLVCTIGYGHWRRVQSDALANREPMLTIATVQRNVQSDFVYDEQRELDTAAQYVSGSIEALRTESDVDLLVWPESSYTAGWPWRVITSDFTVPAEIGITKDQLAANVADTQEYFRQRASDIQLRLRAASGSTEAPPMLVGCAVMRYVDGPPQVFSGAVAINQVGDVIDWCGKRHLVMFGEYIPFAEYMPWLYEVTPLQMGVTPGDGPMVFDVQGVSIAPSICFETMVEHVSNRLLRQTAAEGKRTDLIINITNDAWFGDSLILDHHRRCTQLVAVAHRRPILMSANGGPTVWIDSSGRVKRSLPHGSESHMIARPTADDRISIYMKYGDRSLWPLALFCGLMLFSGYRERRQYKLEKKKQQG